MLLKLKINCTCECSYHVNERITENEISCPNCGKILSSSTKIIQMLKTADEIPDCELCEEGNNISIQPLS